MHQKFNSSGCLPLEHVNKGSKLLMIRQRSDTCIYTYTGACWTQSCELLCVCMCGTPWCMQVQVEFNLLYIFIKTKKLYRDVHVLTLQPHAHKIPQYLLALIYA